MSFIPVPWAAIDRGMTMLVNECMRRASIRCLYATATRVRAVEAWADLKAIDRTLKLGGSFNEMRLLYSMPNQSSIRLTSVVDRRDVDQLRGTMWTKSTIHHSVRSDLRSVLFELLERSKPPSARSMTPEEQQVIRAEHERDPGPNWTSAAAVPKLLAEIDRLESLVVRERLLSAEEGGRRHVAEAALAAAQAGEDAQRTNRQKVERMYMEQLSIENELQVQLAAALKARDEACALAEDLRGWIPSGHREDITAAKDRIADLRAVGKDTGP